ncbi:hypothetical protein J9303_17210 [Bacillaceae bacterium Marseille-Q3522]|nr:hypothetical protein [Bacillaceae bacterium Marseille-Q3522]
MNAIQLKDLTKIYGNRTAVDANYTVSFSIKETEGSPPLLPEQEMQLLRTIEADSRISNYGMIDDAYANVDIPKQTINSNLLPLFSEYIGTEPSSDTVNLAVRVLGISGPALDDYLRELGLSPSEYKDVNKPKCIVNDQGFYKHENRWMEMKVLSSIPTGAVHLTEFNGGQDNIRQTQTPLQFGYRTNVVPMGVPKYSMNPGELILLVSGEVFHSLFDSFNEGSKDIAFIAMQTPNADAVSSDLVSWSSANSIDTGRENYKTGAISGI